ncbi:MAG: CBS domain-containing protein [Nanoarchaeota archaeon]|nr:CBS domain-containing protein [Nanoarchaeota archaeon]
MPYNIKDIKNIRKKLGITQSQLSKAAGVSQSLIAKIESNRIDPAYSNVQKIFAALDSLSHIKAITAKDIMIKTIVSCKRSDNLRDVIKKMKSKEISQLPVIESNIVVGMVTEKNIVNNILESGDNINTVEHIMEDAPPMISKKTSKEALVEMLKFFPLVIVQEKGRILGIITKSDLIRNMFK